MPLKDFKCKKCGEVKKTFKPSPEHCGQAMEKLLVAPEAKFLEPRGTEAKDKGRSVLKDQNKILKERTRNWSRDNEMHDLVQKNDMKEAVKNQWVNADGTVRKKIDDL